MFHWLVLQQQSSLTPLSALSIKCQAHSGQPSCVDRSRAVQSNGHCTPWWREQEVNGRSDATWAQFLHHLSRLGCTAIIAFRHGVSMRTWYHFVLPDEEGSESWLSLGLVVLAGGIVTAKTNWRSFHMLAITSLEGLARPKSFRHGGGTLSLLVPPTLARTLEYPPEGCTYTRELSRCACRVA